MAARTERVSVGVEAVGMGKGERVAGREEKEEGVEREEREKRGQVGGGAAGRAGRAGRMGVGRARTGVGRRAERRVAETAAETAAAREVA